MRTRRTGLLTLGLCAAPLFACGGEEEAADFEPTLQNLQTLVFTPACATSGCHDVETKGGNLDMSTAAASWEGMVEVKANNRVAAANGWLNVAPGDPDRSFLMRKLDGPGLGEGDPMPSSANQLNPFYRDKVAAWIAAGAKR